VLAQANKTQVKIGDAIVQTQLAERSTTPHIIAAMDNLNQTAQSLTKTADAATELTVALTSATGTANQTIRDAQPVLVSFQRSGDDLDSLLRSKAIYDTLDSTAATTEHIAGITGDLKLATDKATKDYLAPQPWYRKVGRYASDAFDYGALFARHTP
jgi:ABC-type transporter Mla subunit MlaD